MNWYKIAQKSFDFQSNYVYNITEPFKEDDILTVYHGFNDFDEAYSAVVNGLSGKERVPRRYSYESNNNPYGLFVSLDRKTVEEFTGSYGIAVIAEIKAKYSDLESPVWPGGSYTVQGGYSQYWSVNNLEKEREQQRLKNREEIRNKAKEQIEKNRQFGRPDDQYVSIYHSDRPELAASLLGAEYQALFVGHLNPGDIEYLWVREPASDGYHHINDPFIRMSRDEFLEKFSNYELDKKSSVYDRIYHRKIFLPNEEFDPDKFVNYMIEKYNLDIDYLKEVIISNTDYTAKLYFWPKQIPGFLEWVEEIKDEKNNG